MPPFFRRLGVYPNPSKELMDGDSRAFATVEMECRLKMGSEYDLSSDDVYFHIQDGEQIILMRFDDEITVHFEIRPELGVEPEPSNSGIMTFRCPRGMFYFHYKTKTFFKAAHMRLVERKDAVKAWNRLRPEEHAKRSTEGAEVKRV